MTGKWLPVWTFAILATAPLAAAPKVREAAWGDLEARIKGKQVALVLPDGTLAAGKAMRVEPEGLRLRMAKSEERLIPKQSVSVLRVKETGKKWRIVCTLAMPFIVVGALANAGGGLPESGSSGQGAVGAAVFSSFAGGYLLGWALDKNTVEIRVIH